MRQLLTHAALFVGSALLVVVVFWDMRLTPGDWFAWFKSHSVQSFTPRAKPAGHIPWAGPPESAPQSLARLPGADSSLSPQPLALILTGTLPGRNAADSHALIGVSRQNPQIYAVGALLANGGRLKEVHAQYVVLERGGHTAQLYLDGSGHPAVGQSPLLTVGGVAQPTPAVPTSHEVITDYLRPTPVYDGEVLRGFQVYPGAKVGIFGQLGLQPGDLITSVDGVPLTDANQAVEVFHQLANGAPLQAVVSRKGQLENVTLDGTVIAEDQERSSQQAAALVAANPAH